jgi:eukaryotic-like serine/threonine-protein kinase
MLAAPSCCDLMCYFLLSAQSPFSGRGMEQILMSLAQEPTPLRELRPEIPADLAAVIHRCLRRDPDERFADIQLVDKALAACICATSWSSEEAAAWWRSAGVAAVAGTESPGGGTAGSETRV